METALAPIRTAARSEYGNGPAGERVTLHEEAYRLAQDGAGAHLRAAPDVVAHLLKLGEEH